MSLFGKLFGWMKPKRPESAEPVPQTRVLTAEEEAKKEKARVKAQARSQAKPLRKRAKPTSVVGKIDEERINRVILSVRMSEKSVGLASEGQHVFEVVPDATRAEVKSAVETLMDVDVVHVRIANVRGKAKRNGRRKNWSKAYVRLAPGQVIEGMETGA